jgi:hypothetical protein
VDTRAGRGDKDKHQQQDAYLGGGGNEELPGINDNIDIIAFT